MKDLRSIRGLQLDRYQLDQLSQVVDALKASNQKAAEERWTLLIQSLAKSYPKITGKEINSLIEHALGAAFDDTGPSDPRITGKDITKLTVGDDAQLASVDLQNMVQKAQNSIQMMTNMTKMLHDTAISLVRKMGD